MGYDETTYVFIGIVIDKGSIERIDSRVVKTSCTKHYQSSGNFCSECGKQLVHEVSEVAYKFEIDEERNKIKINEDFYDFFDNEKGKVCIGFKLFENERLGRGGKSHIQYSCLFRDGRLDKLSNDLRAAGLSDNVCYHLIVTDSW